jgi:hypothetical protein
MTEMVVTALVFAVVGLLCTGMIAAAAFATLGVGL